MRVIGGTFGGRRLRAPAGLGTRPTADRVREALFNILGPPAEALRVLDLYAGSGALGIEALSRGAAAAVFVESDRRAAGVLYDNLRALGLLGRSTVVALPVERALARLDEPFDWIFADPPYEEGLLPGLLDGLGAPGCPLLHEGSLVIVEHGTPRRSAQPAQPAERHGCLQRRDLRAYGQTALSFYAAQATGRQRSQEP